MFKFQYALVLLLLMSISCKDEQTNKTTVSQTTEKFTDAAVDKTSFKLTPVSHASMMLEINGTTIYVDPVGETSKYEGIPGLVLVTDFHGDHFNQEVIGLKSSGETVIMMPQACSDKLDGELPGNLTILNNGDTKKYKDISVTAIPMYNLREEDKNKHVKGRGNGYVIESDGMRIYISGDTEDIPEMRALKDIDIAFVCMNLPYTMTVEAAADAVLEFAPKTVYPYHYRGANGKSDVAKFKSLVNAGNKDITVTQLDWYAE
ncbi:MAG: MBL fold metallo-hydrolase [Gilvibacter sp.]